MPPKPAAGTEPSADRVREIAYDIWMEEGQPHGRDEAHWLMALERARAEQAKAKKRAAKKTASAKKPAAAKKPATAKKPAAKKAAAKKT